MTARLSTTRTAYTDFIEAERFLYRDQNRFPASMGATMRYLTFLSIIEERYVQVGEAVMVDIRRKFSGPSGMRKLTPDQGAELEAGMRRAEVLHLETESFLVFAKMLLDKVANFIEDYFGLTRGISLKSHVVASSGRQLAAPGALVVGRPTSRGEATPQRYSCPTSSRASMGRFWEERVEKGRKDTQINANID